MNSERTHLLGLQAYEGHVVMKEDTELRQTCAWQCAAQTRLEKERLEAAGFPCPLVTGGGTGTFDITSGMGVHTEIQAGSYVLLDARYGALGLPFDNALFCISRVISRRGPTSGVLNVGLKELTVEYGMPTSVEPGIQVIALADEHARISVRQGLQLDVGDVVCLIPSHVDPAMNLHDAVFVWDGSSEQLERWPVDGRRVLPQLDWQAPL
jgi:D-serine deaminase-like pyridoxal phosphate-dependent protein